jgi:hypothetical protein
MQFEHAWTMPRVAVPLCLAALPGFAQSTDWALQFFGHYQIRPNFVYLIGGGHENTLDVWERRDVQDPQPT